MKKTLLLGPTGTLHRLRDDGLTACGRTVRGEVRAKWTQPEVKRACYQCLSNGLRRYQPELVKTCSECGVFVEAAHYGWWNDHYHYYQEEDEAERLEL